MFSYKFYIDTNRNNTLMLRLTNNRKKNEMSMGMRWTEDELQDAMSEKPARANINKRSYLQMRCAILDRIKMDLQDEGRINEDISVIRDMVRERMFGKKENAEKVRKQGNFMPFYNQHIGKYDKRSTRESNEYTIKMLRKYCENIDDMNFEDVNYAWLSDLETWMKKHDMSQNTRKIHFGNIRAAMREAYKRELTDADPFRRFTFRPAKTRKRAMDVELLRKLFDYPVEPFAELYRDMFKLIFMLIGINTVDLFNLKKLTKKGRIEYARSKTDGLFSVKVEPEAMEIIKKYKGNENLLMLADRWSDHRNFRNQMNKAISRIGKAQGKGKKDSEGEGPFAEVTSYWARHSWATIAYELDISEDVISQALGHQGTGAKVTDVYIRRSMDKIDAANRKVLDWVLYGKR